MDALTEAVEAAGLELMYDFGWTLDADSDKPILESTFAVVVLKHVLPVVGPSADELARKARIAALRVELEALEAIV